MANIQPGLGEAHYRMRLRSGRVFRVPGYFGRFINPVYQLALYLSSCAALSMRLFFRNKNGHKTINPLFFLVMIYWIRVFSGDFTYIFGLASPYLKWPKLFAINNFDRLLSLDGFTGLTTDILSILWFLFLQIVVLIKFVHVSIVDFDLWRMVSPFINGFSPGVTLPRMLYFIYMWTVILIGIGLFVRKFADRHSIRPIEREPDSRGLSVFFNWAGENQGRNLDLVLIGAIAFLFFTYYQSEYGWFFTIGGLSLFWEDKLIGDFKHEETASLRNLFPENKAENSFGDIVTY